MPDFRRPWGRHSQTWVALAIALLPILLVTLPWIYWTFIA